MLSPSFETFFAAMTAGGATLLGLVFVAVSIRRATHATQGRPAEAEVLADATLFAMADGFLVSAAAIHPMVNVGYVALAMCAFGLLWAIGAFAGLGRVWARNPSPELRRYRFRVVAPNLLGMLLNATQAVVGVRLVTNPGDETSLGVLGGVILGYYGLCLLRAWALVGGSRFGPRSTFSEARRSPERLVVREHRMPRWPHAHHGPRGPSAISRSPVHR
jgi:hypothetical protein